WAMTADNLKRLKRTEMQMLGRMMGVSLGNGLSNEVIKKGLGVYELLDVVRCIRLKWFDHGERKANED
ncbi:hypothetical protein HELRODRAFT_79630, partial [Helobdella robusta]|uniref:Uncharacterized protein n=1 Tax=Helobdella robusta TaxID=6412 RepID=T1G3R5_HELRO